MVSISLRVDLTENTEMDGVCKLSLFRLDILDIVPYVRARVTSGSGAGDREIIMIARALMILPSALIGQSLLRY